MAVKRLTDLPDYEVAKGNPDIRGWAVLDTTGHKLGIVEDLTIDTEACRVAEALVDFDGHDYLLPMAQLRLDTHEHEVRAPYTLDQLRAMPEAKPWHSHERQIVRATFLPELADAPPVGELSTEDVVELEARHHRTDALEPEDEALPGEDPRLREP